MFSLVVFSVFLMGFHACDQDEFYCTEGTQGHYLRKNCIQRYWVCDHEWDCVDGEDERHCAEGVGSGEIQGFMTEIYSSPNFDVPHSSGDTDCDGFRCNNQGCVPSYAVCDNVDNCGDLSDEDYCGALSISCENTTCLNGGSCFMKNFTRQCSCPAEFDGNHCENIRQQSTKYSYIWLIVFNLVILAIIIVIFIIFSWRMNRNLGKLAVRFTKECNEQNTKCLIDI